MTPTQDLPETVLAQLQTLDTDQAWSLCHGTAVAMLATWGDAGSPYQSELKALEDWVNSEPDELNALAILQAFRQIFPTKLDMDTYLARVVLKLSDDQSS